jgi:regulator of replication initiation timing
MHFDSIEELKEYYETQLRNVYDQLEYTRDVLVDVLNEKHQLELELQELKQNN